MIVFFPLYLELRFRKNDSIKLFKIEFAFEIILNNFLKLQVNEISTYS